MRKVVVLTVFFTGGLGAAFGTHADEQSGFYLGASVGQATNEVGDFNGPRISGGMTFRAEYEAVDVSAGDFQILSAGVVYRF